jgi:hypothetical protein
MAHFLRNAPKSERPFNTVFQACFESNAYTRCNIVRSKNNIQMAEFALLLSVPCCHACSLNGIDSRNGGNEEAPLQLAVAAAAQHSRLLNDGGCQRRGWRGRAQDDY